MLFNILSDIELTFLCNSYLYTLVTRVICLYLYLSIEGLSTSKPLHYF